MLLRASEATVAAAPLRQLGQHWTPKLQWTSRERLWATHPPSALLQSFHPSGSRGWALALEALINDADDDENPVGDEARWFEPSLLSKGLSAGSALSSLMVFECPLGAPILSPLLGMCLRSYEEEPILDGKVGHQPFQLNYLVPPSLLVAISAAAARSASLLGPTRPTSSRHFNTATGVGAEATELPVVFSRGRFLPQDPDPSPEAYLASSLWCVLSPDGSVRVLKMDANGSLSGTEEDASILNDVPQDEDAMSFSEGSEEGGGPSSGALSSDGLLFRADLEMCTMPSSSPSFTQADDPTCRPPSRMYGGGLHRVLCQAHQWTRPRQDLINPYATICWPEDDVDIEVARVCMAEAQVQLQQATSGCLLLSGFEIWKADECRLSAPLG